MRPRRITHEDRVAQMRARVFAVVLGVGGLGSATAALLFVVPPLFVVGIGEILFAALFASIGWADE